MSIEAFEGEVGDWLSLFAEVELAGLTATILSYVVRAEKAAGGLDGW